MSSYDLGEALPSVLMYARSSQSRVRVSAHTLLGSRSQITPSDVSSSTPSNDLSNTSLDFDVIPAPPPVPVEDTKESEKPSSLETATKLRQRTTLPRSTPTSPTVSPLAPKEPAPRPLQRDAAFQFSAMPPPSLRDAQRGFKKVLQAAVELVASQHALAVLEARVEAVKRRTALVEKVALVDV